MSHTMLIADDSIPLHALVKTVLEPEGLSFRSAYDGEAAVFSASSLRPDLILLDVDMPRLDGFEVCRRLKANPLTASIPLIFLTAGSMLRDKVNGLELGAVDYIVKPFKPEELRARVRSALRFSQVLDRTRMIDNLTGLWNQNYFDLQIKSQLSLAQRSGRALSCLLADVDHLAAINVKFGQAMGDDVIRGVGRIIHGKSRTEDVICRLGSGKFAMLMGGTNRVAAARLAERLRSEVERQLQSRSTKEASVTCCFGIADSLSSDQAGLVERADAALYRAKQAGRNCVSIASEPTNEMSIAA
jgi:diguanylate cyclase (GGDEF)-like protein